MSRMHLLTELLGKFLGSYSCEPRRSALTKLKIVVSLSSKVISQNTRKISSSNPSLANAKYTGPANTNIIDEIRQSQHSETVGNWEFHASRWRPPLAAANTGDGPGEENSSQS